MNRSTLFARPHEARGILPLILGALAAGRGIYGMIDANQKKQRTKGYIDEAYRSATQRQQVKEGDVRQGTAESLAARGLLTNGAVVRPSTRIAQAMGAQTGAIAPSRTLGQRAQNENSREFALERRDLSSARDQAQRENKADVLTAQINSGVNGALGIANAYGLHQLGQQGAQLTQGATAASEPPVPVAPATDVSIQPPLSPISSAMAGIDDPNNWYGGIHGISPLTAPGSSWNRKDTTLTAPGASNYDFHL